MLKLLLLYRYAAYSDILLTHEPEEREKERERERKRYIYIYIYIYIVSFIVNTINNTENVDIALNDQQDNFKLCKADAVVDLKDISIHIVK